ncbi:MAG: bifunctional 4-hydroxy-2-oxoglutarate aldolase/2-dehydro-3-deoxy-phosphogluconate aldolase [Anaerolineae bacterium]|nr:bifunctional 4-hydroxy-2-oxoglutarate aldolase/2-dehydro-3-deoxy-phosphogluconate aldolase [Anaerolineae bacterium]
MDRAHLLTDLLDSGVIAVVRLGAWNRLLPVTKALAEGGIRYIEFAMTTPHALEVLAQAGEALRGEAVLGAGTVLDPDTARAAVLAGAQFIVAPNVNPEVIAISRRYGALAIPGALTPTEILTAWQLGADLVKVFPVDTLGPGYIRALKAPLPQVSLVPTGGVSIDNAADYIRAGAAAVCVGSNLVNERVVAQDNWRELTAAARRLVTAVAAAKNKG